MQDEEGRHVAVQNQVMKDFSNGQECGFVRRRALTAVILNQRPMEEPVLPWPSRRIR